MLAAMLIIHIGLIGGVKLEYLKSENVSENGINFINVYKFKERGDIAHVEEVEYDDLRYFVFKGSNPILAKFWSSASFRLDLASVDYQVYIGPNISTVHQMHQLSESAWIYTQLPWRAKEFKMSPFQDTVVGVKTTHAYSMTLQTKTVNFVMTLFTGLGIFIFLMAPRLSRNQFFHFTTGISAGILLSVLILTFMVQKRLRDNFYFNYTWYKEYLTEQYFHWVVGYVLGAGLLSFAIIYRLGPPSNPRTVNLIQWTMQGVSLVCIVLSSYHQVASLSLALLILTWASIPGAVKSSAQTRFRKTFLRPKVKLLTEEEYISQRNAETKRALEELRNYCRSPESKPWQTVTKLRTPGRFAEFIEGSPHITEEEVMEYSHWDDSIETDDDSRSSLTDEDNELGNRSFDGQTDN
ncbi:nuclear envelope integral membrane protein 1 [Eurytemora carolleeae]|uniref:nuclear envelope integral membrane protein 1 n=1 Tax=Eurytemora carolleeae TaxID=1294199 RepID=UPI000C768A7D|nr:nuclear envelope integral membrane protein 1 [Eurytemora carolleeae]|eukprot:XP_023321070.1 nuclear envelope integral membrane protein 1-like [Eurytemora affinis]